MPPRTRATEAPQKPSPRVPLAMRTASNGSEPLGRRLSTGRSPRTLVDRRSPRGSQSDPVSQKKLGTRISGLETQLIQAQQELKCLKEQLSSVEAAKKEAQDELHKKTKNQVEHQGKHTAPREIQQTNKNSTGEQCFQEQIPEETHKETDVFEVPMQNVSIEYKSELGSHHGNELEKPTLDEMDSKSNAIGQLKTKLEEKEKEQESTFEENKILKKQLNEASAKISAARSKEEEMASKCTQLERDLEASKATKYELKEKLDTIEAAKEELEAQMKKLRIQTEQWRKAADAAAAVLAGGVNVSGDRISDRRGSVDKHVIGVFKPPPTSCDPGFLGSSDRADELDDGFGGKRKGSGGIRMLGDLWKKKGLK